MRETTGINAVKVVRELKKKIAYGIHFHLFGSVEVICDLDGIIN
jgi:hypothetical protein